MKTIKGPAIFLAQFISDEEPFNNFRSLCKWASGAGFKGVQIPTWDDRCIDLTKAAESKTYCDELKGIAAEEGIEITELSTHLQGQLVAVHPAYDLQFDAFAPDSCKGSPERRTQWAIDQVKKAANASQNFGINVHATFSGALLWPMMYPWPQRTPGLVKAGFHELAKRWTPILDHFDSCGVDVCYEVHPNEDIHDGITFELFREACGNHPRVNILYDPSHFILQQLDYLQYIDFYHEFIKMFHVKDAEFNPSGKSGIYGGYQEWIDRPGRFRSVGDGQVNFKGIFSKLTQYGYNGWAVLEWECCIKHPEDGAKEGAKFITENIIRVTERSFDDFAGSKEDKSTNNKLLGLK